MPSGGVSNRYNSLNAMPLLIPHDTDASSALAQFATLKMRGEPLSEYGKPWFWNVEARVL